jgi:hypothetical protein
MHDQTRSDSKEEDKEKGQGMRRLVNIIMPKEEPPLRTTMHVDGRWSKLVHKIARREGRRFMKVLDDALLLYCQKHYPNEIELEESDP